MNTNWQPIKSAPTDGTIILAFAPDANEPQVFAVRYSFDDWYDAHDSACRPIDVEPTHWMPLPDPPQFQDAE